MHDKQDKELKGLVSDQIFTRPLPDPKTKKKFDMMPLNVSGEPFSFTLGKMANLQTVNE